MSRVDLQSSPLVFTKYVAKILVRLAYKCMPEIHQNLWKGDLLKGFLLSVQRRSSVFRQRQLQPELMEVAQSSLTTDCSNSYCKNPKNMLQNYCSYKKKYQAKRTKVSIYIHRSAGSQEQECLGKYCPTKQPEHYVYIPIYTLVTKSSSAVPGKKFVNSLKVRLYQKKNSHIR